MNDRVKLRRLHQWRVSREQTTANGIRDAIFLLRTGQYETIEHLAAGMRLTVPQTRWRLREGVVRGLITRGFYDRFKITGSTPQQKEPHNQ